MAALALTGSAASGGGPDPRDGASPYHSSGLLRGSLKEDRPVPIYAPDPQDLWNRVYHLLFTTTVEACISRYYVNPPPAAPLPELAPGLSDDRRLQIIRDYYFRGRFAERCTNIVRLEGGDLPEFFFPKDAGYLFEEPRLGQVRKALEELLQSPVPEGRTLEARVLFQHDLWGRFDALHAPLASTRDEPARGRAAKLRELLGKAIARLALGRDQLRAIRPNFPEIVQAYPQAAPDLFAPGSPWRELVPVARTRERTTLHAANAGHRRVFRVFFRAPAAGGAAACLGGRWRADGACLTEVLPRGSRALLLESLLALAASGEIVPVPLVLALQVRDVRIPQGGPDGRFDLEHLPVSILHGARHGLASAARWGGGLHRLEPDAPVPAHFAGFPRPRGGPLYPAALVCKTCHSLDGSHLMTTAFHEVTGVDILRPENTVAQDRVIRAKQQSPEYQALRKYFLTN